jgi:diguanylate cyclase (GGDEF)-like protein
MIKQEEHLVYLSSTDLLTLVKNRRALQEHISSESEKLQRYSPRRKFMVVETIAFIDLDNFKYYNDNFGHEAGDLLIASFARLLKKVCRSVDFVSRFGGDEFVVVMTDTNCADGKIFYRRLKNTLENANYFIPELEAMLGGKIDIPKEKYLGFSMGLCSNMDIEKPHDLATVMMNADQALYYVKNNKKGGVAAWNELNKNKE